MKTLFFLMLIPINVFAEEVVAPVVAAIEKPDPIHDFIASLVSHYPVFMIILLVVGALRAVMKPLFSLLHTFVDITPTSRDNDWLSAIEKSDILSIFVYALDWVASIKVIPPKT